MKESNNAGGKAGNFCMDVVVALPSTLAIVCAILNFIPFTSGAGTLVSACVGKDGFRVDVLIVGLV